MTFFVLLTDVRKIVYPVDEQILWLEVPVKNVAAVAEGESFQQLVHERLRHTQTTTHVEPHASSHRNLVLTSKPSLIY